MITLTKTATEKISEVLVKQNADAVRLKVVPGGCAGFMYDISLDKEQDGDYVYNKDGAKVVIDSKSLSLLNKSEVDYTDDLSGAGLTINNPNVTGCCGCDKSFCAN